MAKQDKKTAQKPEEKNEPIAQEEKASTSPASELEEEKAAESGSDSDLDDENDVNVDDESSEEEPDSDLDSDDEYPVAKKQKPNQDGEEKFASAFNAIVGSKLKAYDRKDPILARNKAHAKQIESDKLNAKAKKEIKAEHRQLLDKVRKRNLLPSADEPEKARAVIEKEKKLKKTAQRGVVKLFNAVLATQTQTGQDITKEQAGQGKKEQLMTEMSKNKFLDLVKNAGLS